MPPDDKRHLHRWESAAPKANATIVWQSVSLIILKLSNRCASSERTSGERNWSRTEHRNGFDKHACYVFTTAREMVDTDALIYVHWTFSDFCIVSSTVLRFSARESRQVDEIYGIWRTWLRFEAEYKREEEMDWDLVSIIASCTNRICSTCPRVCIRSSQKFRCRLPMQCVSERERRRCETEQCGKRRIDNVL